jgi:NhaP-type Na+/H+ or K+/H+ antiporter
MVFRWIVIQVGGIGLPSLGWRDKLMLSWIAPRGIVTAAVASLFAIQLQEAGIAGAGALKGLVFLTILLTVGIQGFTAPALAKGLGLVQPEPLGGAPLEAALDASPVLATAVQQQPGSE